MRHICVFLLSITIMGCGNPEAGGLAEESSNFNADENLSLLECPEFQLPQRFEIKRKLLNIGMGYNLKNEQGERIAKLREKFLTFGKTLRLYDSDGQMVATGKDSPFTFGRKIVVRDCNGSKIGVLSQSFFDRRGQSKHNGEYAQYEVYNEEGDKVGVSERLAIAQTNIRFFNQEGDLEVALKKGGLFLEKWEAYQPDSSTLDDRLWVFSAPLLQHLEDQRKRDK